MDHIGTVNTDGLTLNYNSSKDYNLLNCHSVRHARRRLCVSYKQTSHTYRLLSNLHLHIDRGPTSGRTYIDRGPTSGRTYIDRGPTSGRTYIGSVLRRKTCPSCRIPLNITNTGSFVRRLHRMMFPGISL